MLDARWLLFMLGLIGCMPGTTLVPGDPRHFDPVGAFPRAAAYADPSTTFLALLAAYVREDGTIDLEAKYIDENDVAVSYAFVEPAPPSPEASFPLGARGPEAPQVQPVLVTIARSRFALEDQNGFQGGMRRWRNLSDRLWTRQLPTEIEPWKHFHGPTPPPRCHFAELWTIARQRGAPAGAVAVIVYDPNGYRFRIDGTPFKLDFDTDCTVKN